MTVVACPQCGKRNGIRPRAPGAPRCVACKSPLPWVVDASEAGFGAEIEVPVPVLVDFSAPWCAPCRIVGPALESLARKRAPRLKLVKVNVDEAPALAARYGATSIPTLVLLDRGREVDRIVGALPEAQLEARLAPHLRAAA